MILRYLWIQLFIVCAHCTFTIMDLKEIVVLGKELGYKGEALQNWVTEERKRQDIIIQDKLARDDRLVLREEHQRDVERAHELEMAIKQKEILELKAQQAKDTGNAKADESVKIVPPKVKIPAYQEHRDNLDAYISRFERYATSQAWPKKEWAVSLSALLQGKALDVYARMSPDEANDYSKLKQALLKRFQLTEEGYRVKFRTSRPEKGETPSQFATRLNSYFTRWVELSGIDQDFDHLLDLLLREQFVQCCSKELATFLKEHDVSSIAEMAELGERFTEARGVNSFPSQNSRTSHQTVSNKNQKYFGNTSDKGDKSIQGNQNYKKSPRRCYICYDTSHLADKCPKRNPKKSVSPVMALEENLNSTVPNQEKTSSDSTDEIAQGCIVDQLHTCCVSKSGNVELKCGHEIVISNLQLGKSCRGLPKNMPTCDGLLSGKQVVVMRDSGSSCTVVREGLVSKTSLTGETKACVLIDGTIRKFPVARIDVDTPYYTGNLVALCVKEPVYDLIIGNVDGAKPAFQPITDWKPVQNESVDEQDEKSIGNQRSQVNHKIPFSSQEVQEVEKIQAVETRAMKEKKGKLIKPLKVPSPIAVVSPEQFLKDQISDTKLSHLWEKAKKMEEGNKYRFIIKNKLLMREKVGNTGESSSLQVVVPTKYKELVMKVAHESLLSGHLGIHRTYLKIFHQFYWPGINQDVTNYCRSCDICQRTLPKGKVRHVPLGKVPMIETPFHRVAMDLIGPMIPATDRGNRYILTVIDYATRYPEAVALAKIDTITVAEALVEIYARVGIPSEVLTDCGTQFTSDVMKEVSRLLSIRQLTSTPHHPICNGLIERFNGTLKQMLKRMCSEKPRDWDRYVGPLLFAIREAPQESLGFSPFELLYGRSVRGPMNILRELWTNDVPSEEIKNTYQYVLDLKERLSETCKLAHRMLSKSSARYKTYYDKKKYKRHLNVGEKVLILLPTDNNKLTMQWKGPYSVIDKFNENDYKIDVNGTVRSYHINLLKKYIPRINLVQGIFEISTLESECDTEINTAIVTSDNDILELEEVNETSHDIVAMPSPKAKESIGDVKLGTSLNKEQLSDLQTVLTNYNDIITDVPLHTNAIQCDIKLTTDDPVRCKPYPIPYARRQLVRDEIDKMLKLGIIERSDSPYAAPIVMVQKKDGTIRFCIDFRKLNRVTLFDPEPMPNPEDLFANLFQSKFFSKIDLSRGYWQIPMTEESKLKTAFVTTEGQYQFKFMPFGLQCAPSIFTRLMRKLFSRIDNVVNYIDDILVHTSTWKDHIVTLNKVFHILQEANLSARPSKCFLGFSYIEFLGHKVGNGILGTNPSLLKRIQNCEAPTTKKEVRSFIGLTSYYRKFVPNFSHIALPLTELTKKGQPERVNWGEAQEKAYRTLKQVLSSPPVLHLPDFSKSFLLGQMPQIKVLVQFCYKIMMVLCSLLLLQVESCYHVNKITLP